jgi:phage-related baseplate assembly protein
VANVPKNIEFIAEHPGIDHNIPPSPVEFITPISGLTAMNLEGQYIEAGAAEETDDLLKQRCNLRWSTLSAAGPWRAYAYMALASSAAITKVNVIDNLPRGQGTLDVVLWGGSAIGQKDVDIASRVIEAAKPITSNVLVYAADPNIIDIDGILTVRPGASATARAQLEDNLKKYEIDLPIGGKIYRAQLYEHVMNVEGAINAVLTNNDLVLDKRSVAVFRNSILINEATS